MAKESVATTNHRSRKKRSARSHRRGSNSRWIADVKTVSTFPPKDTFNKKAGEIARIMASKKVSPKGLGSAIRMVQYFINRGGKSLIATRRRELERAKHELQAKRDKHAHRDKRAK